MLLPTISKALTKRINQRFTVTKLTWTNLPNSVAWADLLRLEAELFVLLNLSVDCRRYKRVALVVSQ